MWWSTYSTATPVSTEEFHEFKSSIDTRFDELKAIILSMQNNTSTSAPPPPTNTTTKVIGFVAASKDPDELKDAGTEKKPVEVDGEPEDFNDDDSSHTTKPKHAKANGTGPFSAVPGPRSDEGDTQSVKNIIRHSPYYYTLTAKLHSKFQSSKVLLYF